MSEQKKIISSLLEDAGITINGSASVDIQVHNDGLYDRVLSQGSLGLGESYMDGWWDVEELDEFFNLLLKAELDKKIRTISMVLPALKAIVFNLGSKSKAFKIGEHHYDIGNNLYEAMLDKELVYTCGYWKDTDNLDQAQINKLDLVCKKMYLKPGMTVIDIGCGWGSFCKFAAKNYGVKVVGVTVSKEQAKLAKKRCEGLDVEIKLQDYRDATGKFDRIVSLGMFEHVGYKNYKTFMKVCQRLLKDDGLFMLHTIGGNKSVQSTDAWIDKYIFPNSMLPSVKQISVACEGRFVLEDWHSFGQYYDKTLLAWFKNFDSSWSELKNDKYDDRFYRMWKYYLLACAGSFRARKNQLWQIVLSKKGVSNGYISIR